MKLQASKDGQRPQLCSNGQLFWLVSEQSRYKLRKGPPRVHLPLVVAERSMRGACSASSLLNVIFSSWTFMYGVWMDDLNDYSLKPKFEKITNMSFSPLHCTRKLFGAFGMLPMPPPEFDVRRYACVLLLHSKIADCVNTKITPVENMWK